MITTFEQHVGTAFPRIEDQDDRWELRSDLDPNPAETARRRLFAHVRGYVNAARFTINAGLDEGNVMQEVVDWGSGIDTRTPQEDDGGESDREIWQRERAEDLQNNFIFNDYLDSVGKHGFRNYAVHLDYRGIRAAIHLLTTHSDGEELLWEALFEEPVTVPRKEDALAFKESALYTIKHPEAWVEAAIQQIPGIYSAAHLLLTLYSEIVDIERGKLTRAGMPFSDSPLPTDSEEIGILDGEEAATLEDRRLEVAITAYATGEGNINEIPHLYDVPRQRFRDEVTKRGIKRSRGGDVRAYRKPSHREEG